jgi:hypothetical protein
MNSQAIENMVEIHFPEWIGEEVLDVDIRDYGQSVVSIYRQPGDLYESWRIESADSGIEPDARYGPDAPDHNPLYEGHVVEKTLRWSDNGWTKRKTWLEINGICKASYES